MMLRKIISGGQTGADQASLHAAKELGLLTGGWMAKNYKTETGFRPDIAKAFGLQQHSSALYPPRTECNVVASDATLIFGNPYSPGCRLTANFARKHGRPTYHVEWRSGETMPPYIKDFAAWLLTAKVTILNVAGNRESKNIGISEACRRYLIAVVTEMRKTT